MNSTPTVSRNYPGTIVRTLPALVTVICVTLLNSMSYADFHFWEIGEIYTNSDSSVQYIELFTAMEGQQNLAGHTLSAFASDGTPGQVFTFPSNLSGTTSQSTVLLANAGFEILTGLSPDFILPENFLFTEGGRINFADVDELTYQRFALPKNGSQALDVLSHDQVAVSPSPTNFFGDSTTVISNINASFDTATLRLILPVLEVPGLGIAHVTFSLTNDNPIELTLLDYYLYADGIVAGTTAATFVDSILSIPALDVGGVYYELNLSLISENPVIFGALDVRSTTEPGPVDATTGERGPISVAGTWTGTLVLDIENSIASGDTVSFILTQNGSEVTGTTVGGDDTGTLSGSINGNTLILRSLTDDTSADCVPFNLQLVFAVSSTGLTLVGASGQICEGSSGAQIVVGGNAVLTAGGSGASETSIPERFSVAYLQGKTFYEVYFGTGGPDDNLIPNVPVVSRLDFGTDGIVTGTGLLNSFDNFGSYDVNASGQLIFQGNESIVSVLSCGSTDQYLKTESYDDGSLDSIDLYFFNLDDALAFAASLTAPIAQCVPSD